MIKFCKHCFEHPKSDTVGHNGYMPYLYEDDYECPICKHKLEDIDISSKDYLNIVEISGDKHFIQAMIKLKQDDIIEFRSRMSQFITLLKQQEGNKNVPCCPICQSTDLSKISSVWKAARIGLFGIFGADDIGKTWECNNCGCKF